MGGLATLAAIPVVTDLMVFVLLLSWIGGIFAVMAIPWQICRALHPLLTGRHPEPDLPMPLWAWIWMLGSLAIIVGWLAITPPGPRL